jgi:hypothetical protein
MHIPRKLHYLELEEFLRKHDIIPDREMGVERLAMLVLSHMNLRAASIFRKVYTLLEPEERNKTQ